VKFPGFRRLLVCSQRKGFGWLVTAKDHLLIVSLGPVQDFIAAARKCQDLWFGSALLCELAKVMARSLQNQGGTLIFPSRCDQDSLVANKIVAQLPSGLNPTDTAAKAKEDLLAALRSLAEKAFETCGLDIDKDMALKQIKDLMEVQWVAVPFSSQPDSYAEAHRRAERLLSSRKRTRTFSKADWNGEAQALPKSSIDGQRESVVKESSFALRQKGPGRLGLNERLCGVGLLKRYGPRVIREHKNLSVDAGFFAGKPPRFQNTSSVAAKPLFKRLEEEGQSTCKEAFEKYIQHLRNQGLDLNAYRLGDPQIPPDRPWRDYDACLLYPDRLVAECEDAGIDFATRTEAKKALDTLLTTVVDSRQTPPAYYAMLCADGDNMGVLIERLASPRSSDGLRNHQRLSAALSEFAKKAKALVENEHDGCLIYAGGDDVLALLPLHTALACANDLRLAFCEVLTLRLKECFSEPTGAAPTFEPSLSVGLAVVHHLEHLGRVRAWAKEAEQHAKRKRNSLAIALHKRSGETCSVSGTWDDLATWLPTLVSYFKDGMIPGGLAQDLRELTKPFVVPCIGSGASENRSEFDPMIRSLVSGVLSRKQERGSAAAVSEEVKRVILRRVSCKQVARIVLDALQKLCDELFIARAFAEVSRKVQTPRKEEE